MKAPAYRLLMTADAVGGVWRYALDAARLLCEAGVAVTLATLGPRASEQQREEAKALAGLELIETGEALDWLCEARGEVAQAAARVAHLARETGADLIQLNGTALAADAQFHVPVLAVHHSCLATWWASVKGGPLPADWIWRRDLTRDHLNGAAAVAAPTRAFAEATAAIYSLVETPRVIYNGRPLPPVAGGAPIAAVFTAGRLWDEAKNIATIDRAALRIAAPVSAAGPLEGPQSAGVTLEAVRPLGVISEASIRARLAQRPVFVSAPLYEPFGLAVLEAAQAGCALLLSDIDTLRELWDGAATFFPARDEAALSAAATRLLSDASLRARMGEAARERSLRYSAARFGDALISWHRKILGEGFQERAA